MTKHATTDLNNTQVLHEDSDDKNLRRELQECRCLLEKAREENRLLRSIMQLVPGNIFWVDAEGTWVWCNANQLKTLGLNSLDDCVGKFYTDVLPQVSDVQGAWENAKKVMLNKEELVAEESGADKDGNLATYLTKKIPLFDGEHKEVVGLLGIGLDITDRKRAEELELELKNKAAQQVIDFTNMIAGSMAHELRTPVQGIGLQIDFLEQAIKSPKKTAKEKQHETLQVVATVKDAVNSMTYMISDMLLKIRSFATGDVPHHDLHLTSAVENITDFLKHYPLQDDARALLQINYTDNFYYMGDKILTRHILSNLTKNALRAIANSEKAKGECKITMEVQCNDDNEDEQFNYLIFRDNAIGMEPDFAARIFDQYVTKTKDKSGTGLGLTFSKMVMKLYGGDIICRSKLGEFTEFVLSFPKLSA